LHFIIARIIFRIIMKNYEKKLDELKNQLCKVGPAIPGTIHVQYRKCGKSNCRCHQSQDHLHGPYHLWYRKVNGKLCTSVIDESNVKLFEEMMQNRIKLEMLTEEILKLGENYVSQKKFGKKNSKKA
jgi:hypothetical protein